MERYEYYTSQFYQWEYRGRGWHLSSAPIQLEAPFLPFVRQLPKTHVADDGKRHTLISKAIEKIKGSPQPTGETVSPDYGTLQPFTDPYTGDLCALQIRFPESRVITPERMKALVTMLSSVSSTVSFEIIGTAKEIVIQLACKAGEQKIVQPQLSAYFPEATVIEDDLYLELFANAVPTMLIDFGLREEFVRPLASERTFSVDLLTSVYGILDSLEGIQLGGIQILFSGTVNPWSESIIRSVTALDGTSFFADSPESPKLAFEKTKSPLFAVTIRAFAQGEDREECGVILSGLAHALMNASESRYNALIPLPDDQYDFETRLDDITFRESHRLGMLLSGDELVHLLHFPPQEIQSGKLFKGVAKTKALPAIAKGGSMILGTCVHAGKAESVTQQTDQRMHHTYVIGATGTGKSTLLRSMLAQDIAQGHGIALLDPHGDLFDSVLSLIPSERLKDVVVVDPSDSEYPVGLNILHAHSEIEKEVLSSDLIAAFKRQSTSWGDQMHSVFSNAVIAFLESTKGGTLADLRRFLIEPGYRATFLQTVPDPHVQYYWQKEYPLLKTNSIGPILTRLDTFLRSKLIRNMIGQKRGLDFSAILDNRKILLVNLPQGLIGTENSYLLGTLFVAKLHQAALARQRGEDRKPFFLYVDEFPHFITPSMESLLSGVRKYHLGLIMAHQEMQQLEKDDKNLVSTIIGNVGTRICFRVGETDAKRLAAGLSFFDEHDLQNLSRGAAIGRMERPENDFSFHTEPGQPAANPYELRQQIISFSRERYATARDIVEQELLDGLQLLTPPPVHDPPKPELKKTRPIDVSIVPTEEAPKPNISPEQQQKTVEAIAKRREESQHRYLQTMIKKMAESRGYKATIEASTPDRKGKVDVLLERDDTQIACEVSVTTDASWEFHNIQKCLAAGYKHVLCCVQDAKAMTTLQKKVLELSSTDQQRVQIVQPDTLFIPLDVMTMPAGPTETTFKGYRVKVSYDAVSNEEMQGKRESVARIVAKSLKKK